MNINEFDLRIGNLVFYQGSIQKITSIIEVDSIKRYFISTKKINGELISEYDPIPLTACWMMKMGFVLFGKEDSKHPQDWYWSKPNFGFSIFNKTWDCRHINYNLKYVHQLQNLYFAINNKELVIK